VIHIARRLFRGRFRKGYGFSADCVNAYICRVSELAGELAAAVRGLVEALAEVAGQAGWAGAQAGELSVEAGGHGWRGIAGRMWEAGEALEAAAGVLGGAAEAGESVAAELGLIRAEGSVVAVAGYLDGASGWLAVAVAEVEVAVGKIGEAQAAVTEVGQQGMMQVATRLQVGVSELGERVRRQRAVSEAERAQAEAYRTSPVAGRPAGAAEGARAFGRGMMRRSSRLDSSPYAARPAGWELTHDRLVARLGAGKH
jgi:hypothetical protein